MVNLQTKCSACATGAPTLSETQLEALKQQIPDWKVIEVNGIRQLQRLYTFKNFREALSFTNTIGELAESEGHHPAILLEWGKVTVTCWTHKIQGLHENDAIMASKIEALYGACKGE